MYKILVIDDDKITHKVIDRALVSQFEVSHTFNGAEGIEQAIEEKPHVILLDVEMPGMNGYEVCDALKQNPATQHIPVVFLSSHSSLRQRMQGYESGGSDYVVKPFVPEDLIAKISVLTELQNEQMKLRTQIEEAQKTAYIAMSGSNELGQAMSFVEKSHDANDLESLIDYFNQVVNGFKLKCIIMASVADKKYWFSNCGKVTPLENQLVSMLHNEKRFYDFGCRTQINYPNLSVLIKNMPIDDMERYGRIKDILPAMMGTANNRIVSICTESALRDQTRELNDAFSAIQQVFVELTKSLNENQERSISLLRDMLEELTVSLPSMGLEEDQEEFILNKVSDSTGKAITITHAGQDIREAFEMVLLKIQTLSKKQNQLVDAILTPTKYTDGDSDLDDVSSVELF